jgi:gliding motility-associated-like protein
MTLGNDQIVDCKNNGVDIFAVIPDTNRLYTYQWQINGTSLPSENSNISKSIQQNSKVILQLINKTNGCFVYDTVEIMDIRQFPVIDAGLSDTLTCIKKSIFLQGSSNTLSGKVNWFSSGGQTIVNPNQLQAIVDQPGWYFIEVIDTSNFCRRVDSVLILENISKPTAVLGNSFTFSCKDSLLYIDSQGSTTGTNILYQWTTTDGKISGSTQGGRLDILAAGTYQLKIIDLENGCSDSSTITIIPDRNSPIISTSVLDTLDCLTTAVDILGTTNSPSGNPLSILWTSLDGYLVTNPTQLQTQVTKPGTYQLTVVDQLNGCSSVSQTIVIQDTVAPGAEAGNNEIWNCVSQQIFLKGNPIFSGGNLEYNWSSTNGNISGPSNQKNIQAGAPGKYFFNVTNLGNGCSSNDSLEIISNTIRPTANIVAPDTLTCKIQSITLNGQGSSAGSSFAYRWFTLNGNIVGNTQSNTATASQTGIYILEITDTSNFCKSYDTVMVTENIMLPSIDAGLGGELTCLVKSISLQASTQTSNTVQWTTVNGNLTGPTQNLQTTANKSGIYYCTVTNTQNGCSAKDSLLITENTNIPSDIHFEVEQPHCQGDKGSSRLIDVTGGEFPLSYFLNGQSVSSFNQNSLPEGFYTIVVRDKNGCETQDTFRINNPSGISVQLTPSVRLEKGANYKITPQFSIPTDSILWISWSPSDHLSCDNCPYPEIINFTDDVTYVVSFANKNGCISSARIRFELIKKYVYTPTIFSPNGDAINDSFYPVISSESLKSIRSMQIFDRWGELVFSSTNVLPNDPETGWKGDIKGRNALPGVYIYILELEWNSGETQRLFGDITVIR